MTTFQRFRTGLVVLATLALAGFGLTAPALTAPAQAATTGHVTGVITLDGKPLKGLRVGLYRTGDDGYDNPRLAVATTDSKGAYSFTLSTAGPEYVGHTIIIRDPSYRIVATSRTFEGRAGKTVTRNARLTAAASITGTVKRGDGRTTQALRVDVLGPFGFVDPYHESDDALIFPLTVRPHTNGRFTLEGLPAGDYFLGFADEGQTYFSQCYDNLPAGGGTYRCDGTDGESDADSTRIRVATGQHVTLHPQVLSTAGRRVSGIVADPSGHPIPRAQVTAIASDGKVVSRDGTSATGSFRVGPLAGGRYHLAADRGYPWARTVTVVDLTDKDTSGLEITLRSRARIAATLTPGSRTAKVAVDVTRVATGGKPSGTVTVRWGSVQKSVLLAEGKGTVKLTGLPKGKREITVSYSGTSSTASASKIFYVTVA